MKHFEEFKSKVVALVNKKPLSKKENEEISENLISLLRFSGPKWSPSLVFHCIEAGCYDRISEACKSTNYVSIATFLFDQSKNLVETLICIPMFLEEFVYLSLDRQTEEKSRALWDFIVTSEAEDILVGQQLSLIRLELFKRLEKVDLIECYLRDLLKNQRYNLSNLELEILWNLSPFNPLLVEIILLRRMKLKKRVNLKKTPIPADLLYLSILNNCILNDEEVEYILENGSDIIKCLFSIFMVIYYPQGKHFYEKIRKIVFIEKFSEFSLDSNFITPELRLIKSTLEQNVFDASLYYPDYLIDYVFTRLQMKLILHDAIDEFFNFLFQHPQFFDHGFTVFRVSKPSHHISESFLRLTTIDNYISNEIRIYLEHYCKSENILLMASKFSFVLDMIKVIKLNFNSIKDTQIMAEIMFNLVADEKVSQSSLEMCLHVIVKDISTGQNRNAWPLYLKIMRNMVDINLVSPVAVWELFRNIEIGNDLIAEFFGVLETLCVIPLIDLGEEGEDFDESIKEPINFLINSLQDISSAPFAFMAICAFPGPTIKKLVPQLSVDLFERIISNGISIEALAKYTMIELNDSLPRNLLLGTSDLTTFKKLQTDLSWFHPKKCSFSWFTETKNTLSFPPILSIPFTLRRLVMICAISWYVNNYSKQSIPRIVESDDILGQTCSCIAFARITGSREKRLASLQSALQNDLNTKNEEHLAQVFLCLQFIRNELEDTEKIAFSTDKKFLDPTINFHIGEITGKLSATSLDGSSLESKGLYYYNLAPQIEKTKFTSLLGELLAQPVSTGLVNALSLAISRGISHSLERNEIEMILSKIPEVAFKQSKFGVWIDAFYFTVSLSNTEFFKKSNLPVEGSFKRIPQEYLVRILFDHSDRIEVREVLLKCEFLPRIDWNEIAGPLSNQLVMKHLVSNASRDNQFVSPSLLALAKKAYDTQILDLFLIQNLDSYLLATDHKTVNNLLLSLDLEKHDKNSVKLLIRKAYDLNAPIAFLDELSTFVSQNAPFLDLLGEFKDKHEDSTVKQLYHLMSRPWEPDQLEPYLCALDQEIFMHLFNLKKSKPNFELIDVILICFKLQKINFVKAILERHCPIKDCSIDIKYDWLRMETRDDSKVMRLNKFIS